MGYIGLYVQIIIIFFPKMSGQAAKKGRGMHKP